MDFYKSIKILCLNSVLNPDEEYELRKIFRFYSNKFHTPLDKVADLPLEDVLVAYFESEIEEQKDEAREALIAQLLEKEEDRKAREMKEEREAVENYEFLKRVQNEEKDKKSKDKLSKAADNLIEATKVLSNSIKNFKELKEVNLPKDIKPENLPQDVKITFTDDLEDEINKHDWGLFENPKKSK